MKKLIFLCLLISISFFYLRCGKEEATLQFDEIIFSEYQMGLLSDDIYEYRFPKSSIKKKINEDDLIQQIFKIEPPYYTKRNPHEVFTPHIFLKITSNRNIILYNRHKTKNGYYKDRITSSGIYYFNSLLDSFSVANIDTIYFKNNDPIIYDGPYYYLSFLKKNKLVYTHIYRLDYAPDEIKRFIEFLKYFINKNNFKSTQENDLFTREFQSIFNSQRKSDPIKVKNDGNDNNYIPSLDELKK